MWGWAAALEDNRERWEPFPRTGGDKPSRPEQTGHLEPLLLLRRAGRLRSISAGLSPCGTGGKRGKGRKRCRKQGAERLPTKNRTRPLGAPHPSLRASPGRFCVAATEPHVSSWRSNRLHTSPLRGGPAALLRRWGGGFPEGHATSPARTCPHPDAARGVGPPHKGRYEEGHEDVQCAFTPAPVWQRKGRDSQGFAGVDRRRFEGLGLTGPAPNRRSVLGPIRAQTVVEKRDGKRGGNE